MVDPQKTEQALVLFWKEDKEASRKGWRGKEQCPLMSGEQGDKSCDCPKTRELLELSRQACLDKQGCPTRKALGLAPIDS